MPKIQILNEAQVTHFTSVLYPELTAQFKEKSEELLALVDKVIEQEDFSSNEKILQINKTHDEDAAKINSLVSVFKTLKEIDPNLSVSSHRYSDYTIEMARKIYDDPSKIDMLKKARQNDLQHAIKVLAKEKLFVDELQTRRTRMYDELRARLSMTSVASFDDIRKLILSTIKIDSYFSTPIN